MRFSPLPLLLLPCVALAQAPFVVADEGPPRKSTTALWVDYNDDGALDVLFGDAFDRNDLHLGVGDGFVSVFVGAGGVPFTDGVFGDVDNDGDPDLMVGSLNRSVFLLNGEGGLERSVFTGASDDTRGVDMLDVDNDGALDLYLARRNSSPDLVLYGLANGLFSRRDGGPHETDTNSNASCAGDADGDGDMDVFVAAGGNSENVFLRNVDGVLTPADHSATMQGVSSTVCAWDDADGDGDMDLFVGSSTGESRLFLNDGERLEEAPESVFAPLALVAYGADWGDVDNDGDLDLVVARRNGPALLFRNDDGMFVAAEIAPEATDDKWIAAAALADYDRDGDLDLALPAGNSNDDEVSVILANTTDSGHWLQVELIGTASNRDGIGARIEVAATIDGQTRTLVREKRAHESRRSQSGPFVHFGLGDATQVESLTVRWPSGIVQEVGTVNTDGFWRVTEAGVIPTVGDITDAPSLRLDVTPNPARGVVQIRTEGVPSGPVRLEAFDVQGRRVWSAERDASGGRASAEWQPSVASGVYVVRATVGETTVSAQVTLAQ